MADVYLLLLGDVIIKRLAHSLCFDDPITSVACIVVFNAMYTD